MYTSRMNMNRMITSVFIVLGLVPALSSCGQNIPGLGGLGGVAGKAPVPEIKVSQVVLEQPVAEC
jgi:hypothetical protein